VTAKKWKLVVNALSGNTPAHQFEIEAANWMGALRGARKELGEEGGLPSGSSCAVTPDGVVTVLDGEARRRFVLTPITREPEAPAAPAPRPLSEVSPREVKPVKFRTIAYSPGQPIIPPRAPSLATGAQQPSVANVQQPSIGSSAQRPAIAQPATVAKSAEQPAIAPHAKQTAAVPGAKQTTSSSVKQSPASVAKPPLVANAAKQTGAQSLQPSAAARPAGTIGSAASSTGVRSSAASQTGGAIGPAKLPQPGLPRPPLHTAQQPTRNDQSDPKPASRSTTSSSALAEIGARSKMQLELMLSRDVEPGPENPLTYRERAYLIPKGMTVSEAEAALRFALSHLQEQFDGSPRGRFVNLAAFDHDWIDRPQRPPLVSLEWRDWRGEPLVDYPAAEQASMPPGAPEGDDRLATVFESLNELAHLSSAAEGLEFSVRLLAHAVGSEALSGCLYDINTDELRFVAVLGKGAAAAQGRAVSRSAGLFGKAAQLEHAALVIPDLSMEAGYDAELEGRTGLVATNMLLRPLTHDGQLLGMLQLINRATGGFSAADVHLVNYLAERLAEFLRDARARIHH
jgi:hypothetical protein